MSNLFKKGFASVALASAMASGVFAGNAAYIDVKVNYLSGMGKAVLGYDETADDSTINKRLDEVELLVSILDEDGNYATKNFNGGKNIPTVELDDIAIGATGRKLANGTFISDSTTIDNADVRTDKITSDGVITRAFKSTKNIHRFIIDYSNAEVSKLMDEVTLISGAGSGQIRRVVSIDLATRDARGLIVRATPNSNFNLERYINEEFVKITIASEEADYNLSKQSITSPGGIAGVEIPIQVYASTMKNQDSVDGRFTFASNLEGKTIVVQALADYQNGGVTTGNTSVALNSIELKMVNGQASGAITITNGMPANAFNTNTITTNAAYGNSETDGGGLGISFVAYVKEKQSINNYTDVATKKIRDNTVMANYKFDTNMTYLGTVRGTGNGKSIVSSLDTIQVRSGQAASLKVGLFDIAATKLSKLWTKTSEIFNVSEGTDLTSVENHGNVSFVSTTKTLTVIDSYGNPAIGDASTDVVEKLDDEAAAGSTKLVTLKKGAGAMTVASNGLTEVTVTAVDSNETNNTLSIKSQKLTIDASDGVLSNVKAKNLTIKTLPLIEVTKYGGPNWISAVLDVNTSADFALPGNVVLSAKAADVKKANANDFTVVIKSGIGDSFPKDNNATFRVYIKDNSGETEFLEGADLKKYALLITDIGGASFTVANLFYKDDGSILTSGGLNGLGVDNTGDGYFRFDYNATTVNTDVNFTIQIGSSGTSGSTVANLVQIGIQNLNVANIQEEEITVNVPVYEDKYTAAYVDVYMENVDDLKEVTVGSVVNFKFTGSAVSTGDVVVIDMNSSGLGGKTNGKKNTEGRIGLVGSDTMNTSGKITTTLPENGIVSVMLYDANKTDKGLYSFEQNSTYNAVTINGRKPVWLNLQDDDDTAKILELKVTDSIVMLRPKKDAIAKIRIDGNTLLSPNKGDGSEDDKAKSFDKDADFMYDGMLNGKENTVKTGLFYALFNAESDVVLLDKYNNEIEGLKEDIGKDVTYTMTDGMEFKNNGKDGSWIKFKAEAAGTEQTLTLTRTKADETKITKTITWTRIKLNEVNTKFMVTTDSSGPIDPNTGAFDVVNSEVVVKIMGDGNTKQSSTTIKVTHSDNTATLRFVKISGLKTANLYTDALVGDTSATGDTIAAGGSYYILSSDKTGTVEITATAKDSKGADITGTHTVTFDAIDLDKPVINGDDVTVGNGEVSVLVQDANLDTVKTTVVVKDRDGKKVADGVYANGKFTAKVASAGTFLIDVIAFDMAGNVQLDNKGKPQPFEFVRISGSGAPSLEEEVAAMLIAKQEYTVAGTFVSHKFGDDKAKNWLYTRKSDDKSFQLLGNASSDEDAFGWKETDAKAGTKDLWYMIKTGDGRFDWVLSDANGVTYKLKGAKSDGSFDFSGRLNLNVSHKDGMLTFTNK